MSSYDIVGRDRPTNGFCGKHRSFYKCGNTEAHSSIGGHDFYHNNVTTCRSFRCRLCWKYGWCVSRANSIECRFLTAEKLFGFPVSSVEHVSASVPKRLYDSSPQVMDKEAVLALKRSGVPSGVKIFHPFRKDQARRDLYFSPHFHVLAWIDGGYDRCRSCVKTAGACWSCDGFEGVVRRVHKDDGWIVSLAKNENGVVEKRESVFGSAWYQLEHSGFKRGVNRFQIIEWFGRVAKRKFKTELRKFEMRCAVCKDTMERSFVPDGVEPIVANRGERGFLKNFTLPHFEDEDGQYNHLRDGEGRIGRDD